jgi:hypothetical protein
MHTNTMPAALAATTQGRDLVTTAEFAKATARASQTIRKNYCLQGECFGIRPVKDWQPPDVACYRHCRPAEWGGLHTMKKRPTNQSQPSANNRPHHTPQTRRETARAF